MGVRTGPKHRDAGAGFTLVELLLAVALVVLLLSAVVYNFSGLQRGAPLDEGANQLEALIRFARAHAASSGRQVQITFEEDAGGGLVVPLGNLRVLWEPDPIARPGIFELLAEAREYVRGITDLITIEGVRVVEGDSFEPESANASAADESAEDKSMLVTFPPIGFFPDGSSDSAEIVVASRAKEDNRRIAVRLQGITGLIRRKLIADELKTVEAESPAQPPGALDTANTDPRP